MSAYLVSQRELLEWINTFLQLSYGNVEECANGAAYCQFMDALYPDFPLYKIVWSRIGDMGAGDKLRNWKLLQEQFKKHGVTKPINMSELVKGKRVHNLPFCQWFYHFFWEKWTGDDDGTTYAATERRDQAVQKRKQIQQRSRMRDRERRSSAMQGYGTSKSARPASRRSREPSSMGAKTPPRHAPSPNGSQEAVRRHSFAANPARPRAGAGDTGERLSPYKRIILQLRGDNKQCNVRLADLQKQYSEISSVAQDIERERDLYFKTLLNVEECVKAGDQENPLVKSLLHILYQTSQEDGGTTPGQ